MKIWIVFIGEELPIDGAVRPWRYGILSDILADRGHTVIRWQPSFYLHKFQRCQADTVVAVRDNYQINLIYVPGYRRHIGFERIRHYRRLAGRFAAWAGREAPPDLILCGMPSPDLCVASVAYGRQHGVPVLLDVRDLWPDIFLDVLPPLLRPLGRAYLQPTFRQNRYAFRNATGILGIRDDFVRWGLAYGGREAGPLDGTFTHAYQERPLTPEEDRQEGERLRAAGVDFSRPIACFSGSFEASYDLETVIEAARILGCTGAGPLQFVLCGDGRKMADLRGRAQGLRDVIFTGRVPQATILKLMGHAQIGLASYIRGATHTLSNKVIEYLCGGLAILVSRSEGIQAVLDRDPCGLTYLPEDPESLAEALTFLLSHPERLAAMQRIARGLYERDFTAQGVYGRMADHLAFVLEAVRGGIAPARMP